ncbi:hypothetical protein [Candidatus Parabeggiatoa sp. HSG14]|uniref:hypothetical protein n=1 Tax=Candidatus Parabeggiatoa sp. HSG14 TaxID=3055593 RepID=UPI0025A883C1|nr:hypothetical protein [Thiotrichales bacterium HSG14]
MNKQKYIALLTFFLVFLSNPVMSQDHHYWSQQFGSRSALMGGAVVGGVRDTSAGFYNPGALGFINQPSLSVSANAYQLERLSIDDAAGTGSALNSEKLSVIPLLASGTLLFERFPGHTFGYTLLAKNKSSIDMSGRVDKTIDVIDDFKQKDGSIYFQGEEQFIGQLIANSEVTELWGGMSWANKVRSNVSMGATVFFAFRNQSQSKAISARAVNGNMMATQDKLDYVDFWNLRALLKLGFAADFDALKLGLTITSPTVNFFGQGSVAGEKSANNFYDPTQEQLVGNLVSNRQDNLDTTYNTPFSIALGVEYAVGKKTNIAATIESFNKQNQYEVITPGAHSFLRNIIIDEILTFDENAKEQRALVQVKDAAESVVNFGFAIEHTFTKKTKGYLSFRTDYETNASLEGNSLGFTNWDLFHITAGATFRKKRSELAVGFTYSYGNHDNFMQLANFSQIEKNNLLGDTMNTAANYNALTIVVGYTYFFDRE